MFKVPENKVLKNIFGSYKIKNEAKRDEITGEWRKIINVQLHAFYSFNLT